MITNKEFFITYKDFYIKLGQGTNTSVNYIRIRNIKLVNNKDNKLILENYLYIPNFKYNLITINRLDKLSYKIRIKNCRILSYKMLLM